VVLQEFKDFIMKGNVLDLAIAVVIGAAFKTVVDGFVSFIVMPLIGALGGKPSFDDYTIEINDSIIKWGSFVTAVVSFLIIAAALFVMIKSFEKLQSVRRTAATTEPEPAEPLSISEELLTQIRDLLQKQTPSAG
jgi:large conductance mechanosensitive channel